MPAAVVSRRRRCPCPAAWLSAYLGHKDPRSTYWYLSAAPELLAHAARLLEAGVLIPGDLGRGGWRGPGRAARRPSRTGGPCGGVIEGGQQRVREGVGGKRLQCS